MRSVGQPHAVVMVPRAMMICKVVIMLTSHLLLYDLVYDDTRLQVCVRVTATD